MRCRHDVGLRSRGEMDGEDLVGCQQVGVTVVVVAAVVDDDGGEHEV